MALIASADYVFGFNGQDGSLRVGGLDISFALAAGAGALSFLSPCVLPLVPAYLCFVAGTSLDQVAAARGGTVIAGAGGEAVIARGGGESSAALTRRVARYALAFVLGFSTVFVALGATASAVSALLFDHLAVISQVAGAVIVVFGLHYMGLFRIKLLNREARFQVGKSPVGLVGAYAVGLAFAFGWTPCIGPILATILTVAASTDSVGYGVSLLSVYALGLGIPFMAAALAVGPFMRFLSRFRRHIHKVEIGVGALLVATGLLIFFNRLSDLSYYLIEVFPVLAEIG